MEEFTVRTAAKCEVLDVTPQVCAMMKKSGNACLVHVPHTTAGITINEFEPNIRADYADFFTRLAPPADYRHNKVDSNAEAHLISAIIKPSVLVPMDKGRLALGTWQCILLVEADGPRERKIYVQVLQ